MITDIYRIKTKNSVYEIHVSDTHLSRCRKEGGTWKNIKATPTEVKELMKKLHIGPSFDVPGVVLTSMVEDYQHYVVSDEPKRTVTRPTGRVYGIEEGMRAVTEHVIRQAGGRAIRVNEERSQS